jgi:hypothetical protein
MLGETLHGPCRLTPYGCTVIAATRTPCRTRFGAALGARKTPAVSAELGFGLVNGQRLNGDKPNEKRSGAVPVRQPVRCRAASASPFRGGRGYDFSLFPAPTSLDTPGGWHLYSADRGRPPVGWPALATSAQRAGEAGPSRVARGFLAGLCVWFFDIVEGRKRSAGGGALRFGRFGLWLRRLDEGTLAVF